MKTQIFALALVMIVAFGATAMPAMAAESTSSEGSFTLGSVAPTVTSIALYESTGTTQQTVMDPTIEYVVKIEVADTNTLDDLDKIEVIIRTLANTGDDDVNNKATYKWTNGATPVWTKEGPTGLWSLEAGSSWPDPLTATSGEWVLHFKPGPVAEEGTVNWEIYAKATDNAAGTGELTTTQKYDMNWRGEISAVDTSYDFGPIGLGDIDDEIITPTDKNIDVTAISNGNYELNSLLSDVKWYCTSPVDEVTLDWDGTLNDVDSKGHFALEVSDTDLAAATYVQDISLVIPGCDLEVITQSESGVTTEIYQWLSVATSGLLPGTYKGDYTVEISTR